ncbi:nitroreductase/quinone reductase family protein [Nocardia sp. NPDC005978]|uniref:nitroreductase/quinone reductase family protein n=1 Tax=Nocardia sp. NPDC005978 TaxID=3156725 RepID=UPI00339EF524
MNDYSPTAAHLFQQRVITEFRANAGLVGGMFAGSTLALLTTVGAPTGRPHTCPLGYLEVEGRPLVVASANGSHTNPAWYHNIRRNPQVTVELGPETFEAIAEIPEASERDRLFERVTALEPGYAEYQKRTARVIPVVVLHRIAPADGTDRVRGLGDFIVESHDWLRAELATVRENVRELAAGGTDPLRAPKPPLAQQLRTHCLDFCGALRQHHTGESFGAFPMLAQRFPGLEPVLSRLAAEHDTVSRLQSTIEHLVESYVPGVTDPAALLAELDSLATQLESHFEYEERSIVAALNVLGPAPHVP